MGVNGEALQLHIVYKKPYFYCKSLENPHQYCKSHDNPYQVLQVMHALFEHAMKSKVHMVNHYHHSASYSRKDITCLLSLALLLVLCTHNNTDSNKLVIFLVYIALYSELLASRWK